MQINELEVTLLVIVMLAFGGCSKKPEANIAQRQEEHNEQVTLSPSEVMLLFSAKPKIRHLDGKDRLGFFSQQGGNWLTKEDAGEWVTIGKSFDSATILLSKQKLTDKGKWFAFDFKIADQSKPFGLIYGEYILLIAANVVSLNKINIENKLLHEAIYHEKVTPHSSISDEWNSFGIVTGYGMDGKQLRTTLYVNGQGIHLPIGNNSGCFGVFLASNNEICIKGFRWQRGK